MGRKARKPKTQVLSCRTDDETAERIREAAAGWKSISEFLLDAAEGLMIRMGKGRGGR
jgi:uncharacterized protein (DUF1778 family)